MKNLLVSTLSWMISDPRHTLAILFVVMMALALAAAVCQLASCSVPTSLRAASVP